MDLPGNRYKLSFLAKPLAMIILLILLSVGTFIIVSQYYMNILFERSEKMFRQELVNIVSVGRNSIEPVLSELRSGHITRETAINRIRHIVRNMTYMDQDGRNYIFMSSYEGIMLVQPFEPAKELTDQWDLQDVNGLYIIRELVRAAKERPEGSFVYYYYYLPSVHDVQKKMAYVVGIPEIECYIGSGVYMERFIQEQKVLLRKIKYLSIMLLVVVLIPISVAVFFMLKRNRLLLIEISTRLEAEDKVRVSRKMLRDLLQGASEFSIIGTDCEGLITTFSSGSELMLGYTADEMVGKKSVVSLHPEAEVAAREKELTLEMGFPVRGFRAFVIKSETEGTENREWTYVRKDGSTLPVSLVVTTIRSDDGTITGYLGIANDITKRRQAEEESRKLEEQLALSQRMDAIGKLAGGIAHDFNNILMIIQGNVSMVKRRMMSNSPGNPDCAKLELIEEYVERGSNLTKQLLGFARQGKYELKTIPVNGIIRKSADFFTETRKEIDAEFHLQEDVYSVEADPGQLEQVLLNIFINSGQAMPGGGRLTISSQNVSMDSREAASLDLDPGDYVRISISDTGIGMSRETMERIFEPFFSTRAGHGGTGLGLASAYGIIRNHGGMINALSEPGAGSTFNIYLPSSGNKAGSYEEKRVEFPAVEGKGVILIVDDEKSILDVASEFLATLGYTVYIAENEQEAVSIYREKAGEIDLVILDMILRGMSGAQVLRDLREINPEVRVVLSSGYSLQGEVRKVMESGCLGFIQKPYDFTEMSNILHKILHSG